MSQFSVKKKNLVFILSLAVSMLWGQSYKITRISQEDGLSFDTVTDIIQDKYGLMWFCTHHGLNRYDGQNIEIFRSNHMDSLSIAGNSLISIHKDSTTNLWILMEVGGISRYNQLSRQFEYFVYDRNNKIDANNIVNHIAPGHHKDYWVITENQINLLNIPNRTYHPFTIASKKTGIPIGFILDQQQKSWLLSETGLYGLDSINYHQKIIYPEPPVLEGKILNGYPDKLKNGFYLSTRKGVFYKFGGADSLLQIHFNEAIDFEKSQIIEMVQNKWGNWFVHLSDGSLFEIDQQYKAGRMLDSEGFPIFARKIYSNENSSKLVTIGQQQSVHIFDQEARRWEPLDIQSPPFWTCIEISREGVIWLGSWAKGVFKLEPKEEGLNTSYFPKTSKVSHDYSSVNALLNWDQEHLFVGSSKGLFLLNSTNSLSPFSTNNPQLNQQLSQNIRYLMKDEEDYIWASMLNGLLRFHPQTGQYRLYNQNSEPELLSSIIMCTLQDRNKNIWIAGWNSLCVLPAGQDTLVYFYIDKDSSKYSSLIYSRTLYEDSQHNIWIGTGVSGLVKASLHQQDGDYKINLKHFPWKHGLTINQILEKDKQYLWLGNYSTGLMLFDRKKEEYVSLTEPCLSNIPNVQGLLWQENKLWISAINGLYSFQENPQLLNHYTTLEGLHNNIFNLNSCLKKRNGDLLFGGQDGLTCINPEKIRETADPYEILLTDFYLSGSSIPTSEAIQELKSIQLPWNKNYLGFEIRKPIYFSGQKHKLLYRLEGLETYWTELSNQNRISYPALKPGDYTLQIRALGRAGFYQNQEKKIAIHISQPFWKSSWFPIASLLFLMFIGFLFYRQMIRNKMQRVGILNMIRRKAAADFHDEMGHRLARISLFAEVLEYKLSGSKINIKEHFKLIKENIHSLNSSMRDFLWALDPTQDSAFDLALILKDFGDDFFDQTSIGFTMDTLENPIKKIRFTMDKKRHIVFIFKEAMTNILKHAKASNTSLSFVLQQKTLVISLKDNGIGIIKANKGYGIQNMQKRAHQIKARLSIHSEPKSGTLIRLELPINQNI